MRRAYVQGDWASASVSGYVFDRAIQQRYQAMLDLLRDHNVHNTATWHTLSSEPRAEGVDAQRNCREIDDSDVVVSYLQRIDPVRQHWGSLSLIGYALGARKHCVLLAPRDCVVWKHHLVYHPSVVRIAYIDHADALLQMSKYIFDEHAHDVAPL